MPFIGRDAALRRLRWRVAAREPIIGAAAGTGISAKFAERGGVDLVIVYNSGRFRMADGAASRACFPTATPTRSSPTWRERCCRDVLVICHRGPIAEPSDVEYVLARTTGIDGFFGASSIERFATEVGIEEQARRFRTLALPDRKPGARGKPARKARR